MTPLQRQFQEVTGRYPNASIHLLPSGAGLIVLPEEALPPGWSAKASTLKFIAPIGYPFAAPDCFWTDKELRLQDGSMPKASNITPIPEINDPHLWFSWHVQSWNANRDTLLSYIRVIKNRFFELT